MFTIKGCSLIRGVHYERFHCIEKQVIISIIVNENFEPGFLAFTFSVLSAFKRA